LSYPKLMPNAIQIQPCDPHLYLGVPPPFQKLAVHKPTYWDWGYTTILPGEWNPEVERHMPAVAPTQTDRQVTYEELLHQ
jgi:hypothetical protein